MHSFRDNTVLLQAAYAVIVISPPRALYAILYDWFWKSDNDFLIAFHGKCVSAMHGFRDNKIVLPTGYDVIVSPPPGGAPSAFSGRITCSAVPYGNMETSTHHSSETSPNKTIKFCTFDYVRLLRHCAWNYLYPFGLCGCAKKTGRKKSHKNCIFHVCVERPLARGVQSNLAHMFISLVIKRAKFHRYNLRGLGAVRCWSFHVSTGNQGRP